MRLSRGSTGSWGRKSRCLATSLLAGALVLSASGAALAQQPTAADRETARNLMDEGDKKRDAGDLKTALQRYQTADEIMKVPTTGLEVAKTQIALGLLIEARETLTRVLRIPQAKKEPEAFVRARQQADQLNGDLAGRIPTVQLDIKNADPAQPPQVTIDGESVPAPTAQAPRKLNPGAHTVVVRSGSFEKKIEITLLERDTKSFSVDLAKAKRVKPEKEKPEKPETPAEDKESSTPKFLMYGGFGLAVVGVAVGSITGLMSISKTNELKAVCPNNNCPAGRQPDIDSAQNLGNISTLGFVVGGIGVAAGIAGILMSPSTPDKDTKEPAAGSSARLTPLVGPGALGLRGTF